MAEEAVVVSEVLRKFRTNEGKDLLDLSNQSPVLLVFLRHLGCPFSRVAIKDLGKQEEFLKEAGVKPVLVHLGTEVDGERLLAKLGVSDVSHVSDVYANLFHSFGLKQGTPSQLFGPKVLWEYLVAVFVRGSGFGKPKGDVFQLPGVFLIEKGKIIRSFRHSTCAERPDYRKIVIG